MKKENNVIKKKFGLLTTIAMIAGIVIGSGIFFQTPKVIQAVGGNIYFGIAGYLIVATSIIFGGLTVSQYAKIDDAVGGLISYCEIAWGKTLGLLAGWTQGLLYYPPLVAILSWVSANYLFALFGQPNLLTSADTYISNINVASLWLWIATVGIMLGFYLFNIYATKVAGKFQSFSLITKLIALVSLTVLGLIFGNTGELFNTASSYPANGSSLLAVLATIAFAYDGWLVAPSIAHEIKDAKSNLTKALIISPIIVTVIYVLYFIALTAFVGPQAILDGTDPTSLLATQLFGEVGMKIVLAFVVVSVMGALNGLVLAYIRVPYSLAVRKEIPFSEKLSKVNKKLDIPVNSAIISILIATFWLFLHFSSIDGNIMWGWTFVEGLEIDVLPIVIMYFFYITLYIGVIKNKLFSNSSVLFKYVYPVLATLGASIIIYGATTKPKFLIYLGVSVLVLLIGLITNKVKNSV